MKNFTTNHTYLEWRAAGEEDLFWSKLRTALHVATKKAKKFTIPTSLGDL